MKKKFLLITTIPTSLFFFKGQVGVLKTEFDVEVVTSNLYGFDKFCEEQDVVGHTVNMERDIAVVKDLESLFKLISLFRKIKPSVIHGNTPKGGILSMVAGWVARVPHRIYCVHGLRYQGASGFKRALLKTMERISCALATDVFTVSFGVQKVLKTDGVTNKNVSVIWNGSINGIDTSHFNPDSVDATKLFDEYKIESSHFVFGFVGRLVKDKGINELIEAFASIHKKHPNTKLVLVGDYEKSNTVNKKTKQEIEINPNIILCGWQLDIRPYLKLMDLFIFPSYREGFGLSLMEAAAMNVPAISSNITGCNEIIEDDYNGKLIAAKSVFELEKEMEELLLNPKKLQEMVEVSRAHVIKKYEQEQLWNESLKYYKKIVENV